MVPFANQPTLLKKS